MKITRIPEFSHETPKVEHDGTFGRLISRLASSKRLTIPKAMLYFHGLPKAEKAALLAAMPPPRGSRRPVRS